MTTLKHVKQPMTAMTLVSDVEISMTNKLADTDRGTNLRRLKKQILGDTIDTV